jgi:hypothetical protein
MARRNQGEITDGGCEIRGEYIDLIRDAVSRGSPFSFKARGSSMLPLIPDGTEVTVERIDSMPPPGGSILVGVKRGRLFCHRLVGVEHGIRGERLYALKGDNHRRPDEPFPERDLVGKVTALRYGRLRIRADGAALKTAGLLWMSFPAPAIFATRLVLKLTRPARRVLERLVLFLHLSRHGNENHR